jgi:hypothetical protein
VQLGQSVMMIKLNVISHLYNFIENCLVEIGGVLEVKCPMMISLTSQQFLEDWTHFIVHVKLVDDLREEVKFLGFFGIKS